MDDTRAALDALVAQHPSSSPGRHGTREPWNRPLRRNIIDYSLRILGLSMAGVGPSMAGVRGRTKPYLFEGPDSGLQSEVQIFCGSLTPIF